MLQVSPPHLSFRAPGLESPGCPESSRFQLSLPGTPMTFPGQPRSASSGFTGDRAASFPASHLLQRLRLLSSGCPRNSAPPNPLLTPPPASRGTASSGYADGDRTGRPAPSCPSAIPNGGSPGSPGFRAFRPFRLRFPGLPRLCGFGWVNDVSPPSLELCICCYPACDSPGVPASCARWLCRG